MFIESELDSFQSRSTGRSVMHCSGANRGEDYRLAFSHAAVLAKAASIKDWICQGDAPIHTAPFKYLPIPAVIFARAQAS